jgi:hypothetical protein
MNYLKVYCNLIRKGENRTPPEGYIEKHHTFPKSIFGKNNRIVILTAREHYIAHALLERIYIKRYGLKNKNTIKMIYAHSIMKTKGKYVNSYLYEGVRKRVSYANKGRKMSEDVKKKIGDIHRGKKLSEEQKEQIRQRVSGKNNPNYGKGKPGEKNSFYGKKHTEETKEKISKKNKGRKLSNESKRKISEFNKGKILSQETRNKVSDSRKKHYSFINPNGEIIEEYTTLLKFSKKYNLDNSTLSKVVKGVLTQHKGWTLYKLHTPLAQ